MSVTVKREEPWTDAEIEAMTEAVPGNSAPMCTTEVYMMMKSLGYVRIGKAYRLNEQTGELEEY